MTPAQKAERLEDVAVAMIPELDTEQLRRIFEACDAQLANRERGWQTRSALLKASMRGADAAYRLREAFRREHAKCVRIKDHWRAAERDRNEARSEASELTKALKRCRGLLSLRLRGCVQDRLASPAEEEAHRLADRALKGARR